VQNWEKDQWNQGINFHEFYIYRSFKFHNPY
jgi:hypothetical protein